MGGGCAPNDIDCRRPLHRGILIKSPASIANLGPGFDILGLAVNKFFDIIRIEVTDDNSINVTAEGAPNGSENVAYHVAKYFQAKYCGDSMGLKINVRKGVPVSAGLGSSGASSAGVAMGLFRVFSNKPRYNEVLEAAAEGEFAASSARHYDNIAASLLGGLVLVGYPSGLDILKITPPPIWLGILVMRINGLRKTEYARKVIPRRLDLGYHVYQSSALASLIASAMMGDPVTLGKAITRDVVAEPFRKKMIPFYDQLKSKALNCGALGFNISGAGPSVFLVHNVREEAERIVLTLHDILRDENIESFPVISRPDLEGVVVLDGGS
ncbi:MAG: homoserine kinase [Desulfurococcales archaeon]|nr:homoserine kinase [Desulfurococcales archaeon]